MDTPNSLTKCSAAVTLGSQRHILKFSCTLMDELGVNPGEAVIVGDSIEADMKGTLTVGMQII